MYIKKGTVYNELKIINQNELIISTYASNKEKKVYLSYSIDNGKNYIRTPIYILNSISSIGSFNLKTCCFNKHPYDISFTLNKQN